MDWFSLYLYIFVSISRNWKIFHLSILLLRNGKNLNDLQYFQIEKRNQIEKLENTFISTKWKKWSNFLYFSTYLTLFPQWGKISSYHRLHEVQKKLSNFLYFFTHVCFDFHKVKIYTYFSNAVYFHKTENISPTHCIYSKWINV